MGSFKKKNQNKKNAKGLKTNPPPAAAADGNGNSGEGYQLHNPLKGYNKVTEQKNAAFEAYYRAQNICESEQEFQTFLNCCRSGLPSGMRVNGTLGEHGKQLWRQFQSLLALEEKGENDSEQTRGPGIWFGADDKKNGDSAAAASTATASAAPKNEAEQHDQAAVAQPAESKTEEQSKAAQEASMWMLRPKPLTWYPRQLAFQFDYLDARVIKKDKKFKFLKEFLMNREQYGALQRQETVSMIPPHLLNIGADDLVLDLCAAPGSKTCQMLEQMHWEAAAEGSAAPAGPGQFSVGKGGVLANDVEWKRANMLTHQVQRIGSPGVAVLNTDAQFFPKMKDTQSTAVPAATPSGEQVDAATKEQQGTTTTLTKTVHFDKVLCDVPCSGDGTIRKTPNIWRTWTLSDGLGLHFRQLAILWRGLDVLKVGGRLVYSTCSLNPMENEAVINACLARCNGSVVLVEDEAFAGLNAKPGLTSWLVPHPRMPKIIPGKQTQKVAAAKLEDAAEDNEQQSKGIKTAEDEDENKVDKAAASVKDDGAEQTEKPLVEFFRTYEEVPTCFKESNKIRKTMFPNLGDESGSITATEELRKTRRFLPHLMNTGGFFVAILEKRAELPRQLDRLKKQEQWQMEQERKKNAASQEDAVTAEDVARLEGEGDAKSATDHEENAASSPSVLAGAAAPTATPETEPPAKRAKVELDSAINSEKEESNTETKGKSKCRNKKADADKEEADESADDFQPIDDDDWASIQAYYDFGHPAARSFFYKRPEVHGDHKIYGISEKLREVVQCCQNTGSTKVVSCGVRCFQMLNSFGGKCTWRLTQNGMLFLLRLGLSPKRILNVKPALVHEILAKREVKTDVVLEKADEYFCGSVADEVAKFAPPKVSAEEGGKGPEITAASDPEKRLVGQGSYALCCQDFDLHICVLVSKNFFTLYVGKEEAKALAACLKVGADLRKEFLQLES